MAGNFIPLRDQSKQQQQQKHLKNKDNQASLLNADQIRSRYGIEVDGENIPGPVESFEQCDLPHVLVNYLKRSKKFPRPTPVQMQSIGCLTKSRDVICLSSTGTGKTYGYLLPMCSFLWKQKIAWHGNEAGTTCRPVSLIIVPTRELMYQVLKETEDLVIASGIFQKVPTQQISGNFYQSYSPHGPFHNSASSWSPYPQVHTNTANYQFPSQEPNQAQNKIIGVCGGVPIKDFIHKLKSNPAVVIATPGRLIDLCERNHICLNNVKYFVIDECDKILSMGMEEQLRKLIAMVTIHNNDNSLLTSLWSATLPESLERIARSAVINPVYICCGLRNSIPVNIIQHVRFLHTYQKREVMLEILRQMPYPPVIVFASSKDKVDDITELLQDEQFHAAALHSGYEQRRRNEVLQSFRDKGIDILVATDLASRGLDIPAVTHVINFDTPDNIQDYIHRVGRTGRFGRKGEVTTLLTLDCKIAEELKGLLEESNAEIPPQLKDVKMFGKNIKCTELGDRIY